MSLPKMRTAPGLLEELKKQDPETEITLFSIRKIVRSGALPVVRCGKKMLVDYDLFCDYLRRGQAAELPQQGVIRPLPERMRGGATL